MGTGGNRVAGSGVGRLTSNTFPQIGRKAPWKQGAFVLSVQKLVDDGRGLGLVDSVEMDGLPMPRLLPSEWTTAHPSVPSGWKCSECHAAFDMEPLHGSSPTHVQIDRINSMFRAHCQHVHRGSLQVSGLESLE